MPDTRIYLPDDMWIKFKKEPNRSKLIQELLKEYWEKKKRRDKK